MAFVHAKYNTAFNEFLEDVKDFKYGFVHAQQSFKTIARVIINIFISKAHLDIDDPEHPFNRYGNEQYEYDDVVKIIKADVSSQFGYVCANAVAFFHSGGVCNADFEKLLDAFFNWIDASYSETEETYETEEVETEAEEAEEIAETYETEVENSNPN